ncbi:MAG TPA: hypothetical protein VJS66_08140 [Burkholderiales bacterium]|nr:hypothetical protein [Burkholderiales bacterium]
MKRSAVAPSILFAVLLSACEDPLGRGQPCDGECSGSGSFLYKIEGHPCPDVVPWDDTRAAAEEAAKRAARIDAAVNCRARSGNNCTCAFGRLVIREDTKFPAWDGAMSFTDVPEPVCVVIVNFAYDCGTCSPTEQFVRATAAGARCSGTVNQGGHGVATANPPCPQPCNQTLLDRAEKEADADAERKSIAACQALGDPNCLAVGGTKIDIGGRCFGNTVPGEPPLCVYEYYTGLMRSVCAFVP